MILSVDSPPEQPRLRMMPMPGVRQDAIEVVCLRGSRPWSHWQKPTDSQVAQVACNLWAGGAGERLRE